MVTVPFPPPVPLSFRDVWCARLPAGSPFEGPQRALVMGGRVFYHQGGLGRPSLYGALDAQTGRSLWRVEGPGTEYVSLVAVDGHLFARGADRVWQMDPRDGTAVWETSMSPRGLGPVVAGDRAVLETAPGRLEAFDLRTHRAAWRVERTAGFSPPPWGTAGCVAGGAFWVWTGDDRVLGIDLATGRVRFEKPLVGGGRPEMVGMGGAVALFGAGPVEAWEASDGAVRWRSWHLALRRAFYAAAFGELWTLDPEEGELYRFRASTGARVGPPVRVAPFGRRPAEIVRWGEGYAVVGMSRPVGFVAPGRRARDADAVVMVSQGADGATCQRLERTAPSVEPPKGMPPDAWREPEGRGEARAALAGRGRPATLATIRSSRRRGPFPAWVGDVPPPPRTETERVLAAALDARMRFWPGAGAAMSLVYGPSVRPFAVGGWAGSLRAVTVPRLAIGSPSVRVPTPWVRFVALDLDGTMVRFSEGGSAARARVYVSKGDDQDSEVEFRLRRAGRDWFVVSASSMGESPFGPSRVVR